MHILEALKESEDSLKLSNLMPFDEDITYRKFHGIQIHHDLWLSVQASYSHYCTPRKTLKDINEYTEMEMALMDRSGFLRVTDILPEFPKLEEIEQHEEQIYAYVPVTLLNELFEALCEKYKLDQLFINK